MGLEAGWMFMVMGVMGGYAVAMVVGVISRNNRKGGK